MICERRSTRLFTESANHFFNAFIFPELGVNNTTLLSPINGHSKKWTPPVSRRFYFPQRNSGQTLKKNFLKSGQVISEHSVQQALFSVRAGLFILFFFSIKNFELILEVREKENKRWFVKYFLNVITFQRYRNFTLQLFLYRFQILFNQWIIFS